MLSSQAQHHQLSVTLRLHDRRYRQFSSSVVSTLRRHHFLTVHSSLQNPDTTTTSTNNQDVIFRKHNYVMIRAASIKQSPKFPESSFNVRARIVIDCSHVVPLIRWLKHNLLSYPQIGKLICMSKGNLDSIRYMAERLKSIQVKGRYIGFSLVKARGNILEKNTEELNEIVTFLESSGVNRDWIGYIMGRCSELLSYSLEEVKSRAQFYFDMGMNKNDFAK